MLRVSLQLLLLFLVGKHVCLQQNNHNDNVLRFEINREQHAADIQEQQTSNQQEKQTSDITDMKKILSGFVTCPDGVQICPSTSSCCQDTTGEYGCCPFLNAVCCSDKAHCCPNGYECNVSNGTCKKDTEEMSWISKVSAKPAVDLAICSDGYLCPDNTTCCQLPIGRYGCCAYPQAVCCSDQMTCCPNGYICGNHACIKNNEVMKLSTKIISAKPSIKSVTCPDSSYCPDGNTCCLLASGDYGCCSYSQAVCCSDKAHCCPNGYECNVSNGTCKKDTEVMSWASKVAAKPAVGLIMCPDGYLCPDNFTCCLLPLGNYGCCPYPQAVCCPDQIHCCPNGYTCSVNSCIENNEAKKLSTTKINAKSSIKSVTCPDGSSCQDGNTCCLLASGDYGCCPYPQAVCCSDLIHCCPNGYTCDTSSGTCTRNNEVMKWSTKIINAKPSVKTVTCPDGSYCQDGNTCCLLASGDYGCCPYPQAVCCSDKIHCCPNGYTCDTSFGTCTRNNEVMKWSTKIINSKPSIKSVICPDGSYCIDGSTCCLLASGDYGCCPYSQAVCCSDQIHCCPNGYTCNTSSGTCTRNSEVMKWSTKIRSSKPSIKSVTCPDGSYCTNGNTCCLLASGDYGCCSYPQAVCCSDQIHCCPNGYTCNISSGTCTRNNEVMKWSTKIISLKPSIKSVTCPDGSYCPDGNTCCLLASGDYGCCSYPQVILF